LNRKNLQAKIFNQKDLWIFLPISLGFPGKALILKERYLQNIQKQET